MNELRTITADEARAMMPSKKQLSEMLLNHTYRRIKGAAVANQNYIDVSCNGYRASVINNTIKELKENGFKTAYDCEYDRLIVMW